jgi:hypothetical protein
MCHITPKKKQNPSFLNTQEKNTKPENTKLMKTTSCKDFAANSRHISSSSFFFFLLLLLLLRIIIIINIITIQTQNLMSDDVSIDQRLVTKCLTILILVSPSPWNAQTNPQRQKTKENCRCCTALHCTAQNRETPTSFFAW